MTAASEADEAAAVVADRSSATNAVNAATSPEIAETDAALVDARAAAIVTANATEEIATADVVAAIVTDATVIVIVTGKYFMKKTKLKPHLLY